MECVDRAEAVKGPEPDSRSERCREWLGERAETLTESREVAGLIRSTRRNDGVHGCRDVLEDRRHPPVATVPRKRALPRPEMDLSCRLWSAP